MVVFYRSAFHSSKWPIFQYLSIKSLWYNLRSIWPTEMCHISKDCIFNGLSAGTFRFSVECIVMEIYLAQVWIFLHHTFSTSIKVLASLAPLHCLPILDTLTYGDFVSMAIGLFIHTYCNSTIVHQQYILWYHFPPQQIALMWHCVLSRC